MPRVVEASAVMETPISRIPEPKKALKPYIFHGLDLSIHNEQATTDCVFCGKTGKFSVNTETGMWRCWSCQTGNDNGKGGGGNILTFLRLLHKASEEQTKDYNELVVDRKLLSWEGLAAWGVAQSFITGEWIVPGYGPDKQIKTLYIYRQDRISGRYRWLPTPELGHWIHGGNLYELSKPDIHLVEGLWDGIALWEIMRQAKPLDNGGFALTGNHEVSAYSRANILAVQSCGAVGTPFEKVTQLFAGKHVYSGFDSDHERIGRDDKPVPPAGWEATKRAGSILMGSTVPPRDFHYLHWGEKGFDPSKPSGYDVRDLLTDGDRIKNFSTYMSMFRPLPGYVETAAVDGSEAVETTLQTVPCQSWKELIAQWRKAMKWRQGLEDVLAVMLAVALSTEQSGDQLFLQVIGPPGGGKTRFCDAMLTSTTCHALEHLTGFHSGWKGEDGEDFSLLARINNKTLITAEGDTMLSNPKAGEIMSQQRRIFDGTSGASYKNRREDLRYTNLRTPWILVGTPHMIDMKQSRVGDRFLRIFLDQPDAKERQSILLSVAKTAIQNTRRRSSSKAGSSLSDDMRLAYQMTGGYIDYMRSNAEQLLAEIDVGDEDALAERCSELGEFTALFRARPLDKKQEDAEEMSEMPTRLTQQFVRLSMCLTVVLGKHKIDNHVKRMVHHTAVSSASGKTFDVAKYLYSTHRTGAYLQKIAQQTGRSVNNEREWVRFLRKIGVVEWHDPSKANNGASLLWRLTKPTAALWKKVIGAEK